MSATVSSGAGWVLTTKPSPGGTGPIIFSNGQFAAGATATLTVVVKVNNVPLGTVISNTASIGSGPQPGSTAPPAADPDTANNTATVEVLVGSTPPPPLAPPAASAGPSAGTAPRGRIF
jgi:hypothetical protein